MPTAHNSTHTIRRSIERCEIYSNWSVARTIAYSVSMSTGFTFRSHIMCESLLSIEFFLVSWYKSCDSSKRANVRWCDRASIYGFIKICVRLCSLNQKITLELLTFWMNLVFHSKQRATHVERYSLPLCRLLITVIAIVVYLTKVGFSFVKFTDCVCVRGLLWYNVCYACA